MQALQKIRAATAEFQAQAVAEAREMVGRPGCSVQRTGGEGQTRCCQARPL